ncbi:MAG: hypothetical protein KDK62_03550, partial [Chlamydiia bacterium]|nr:hypothetical protein [Chlamydiia bacterium]
MFFNKQDNEKKIKALLLEHEALNEAIDRLFKESNVSQETLARFQHLKAKLSPEDLKAIDQETEKLKNQTQIGIDQVRNP